MPIEVHRFWNSTLVYQADFDPDAGLLSVCLRQSDISKCFGYAGVVPKTFEDFKNAKSPGQFYNTVIRKNHLALGECEPLGTRPFDDTFITQEDIDRITPLKEDELVFDDPEAVAGVPLAVDDPMPPTTSALSILDERIDELIARAVDYQFEAAAVSIVDNETLLAAEEIFKAGKALQKVLTEEIQPVTRAHYETYKFYKEAENRIIDPIEDAVNRLSKAIYRYRSDAERLAAIETQRLLDEQKTQEELPGRVVFVPRSAPIPPKTAGTTKKKKLIAVVDDLERLVLAIADGLINGTIGSPSLACVEPHQPTLNAAAKGKGEEGELYPGVRVVDDGGLVKTRGGKDVR